MEKTGIQEAIDLAADRADMPAARGYAILGAQLGVSRQVVRQWADTGFAPYGRARQIEHHTGVDRRRLVDPVIRDLFDFEG